jgi:hypothetical protein
MSVMIRIALAVGGLLTALLAAGSAIHAVGAPRDAAGRCVAPAERSIARMPVGFPMRGSPHPVTLTVMSRPASTSRFARAFRPVRAFRPARAFRSASTVRPAPGSRSARGSLRRGRAQLSAASMRGRGLGIATLITWLLAASIGVYMLHTWIDRGGLLRQRASGDRFPRLVIFGHVTLASTGLGVWSCYLVTNWIVLAWTAVGMLALIAGLGISTVTVFTPYPARAAPDGADQGTGGADATPAGPVTDADPVGIPAGRVSDEVLAKALTDDALAGKLVDDMLATLLAEPSGKQRKPQWHVTALIPAFHGVAAITTILLAVLTAATAR